MQKDFDQWNEKKKESTKNIIVFTMKEKSGGVRSV